MLALIKASCKFCRLSGATKEIQVVHCHSLVIVVCRQNRIDKYYYYIRLRMDTPESTSFLPVAYSVCKDFCAKLRRRKTKKKPKRASKGRQKTDATSPLLPGQPPPPTGAAPLPFSGARMPPRPPGLPQARPGGAPAWGPRFPPPARFPPASTRFPRLPTMPLRPRPPV